MKKVWTRHLGSALIALVILAGVLYAGDWLLWSWRASHGTGYGTVEVRQFLATSLKGNKTEYDLTGTVEETCSRSIFPQQGNPACWWLERHRDQWQ
jgi:hypothetical protein